MELVQKTCDPEAKWLEVASLHLPKALSSERSAFYRIPERQKYWDFCEKHGDELSKSSKSIFVIGIGGSSLGGKAICNAFPLLNFRKNQPNQTTNNPVEFIENVDGYSLHARLEKLEDLSACHWIIISKSGQTVEPLAVANFVAQAYRERDLIFSDHVTVLTEDKDSPLRNWAQKNNTPYFALDADVGGRFSVLSPVGMLPSAAVGLDLQAFRQGAQKALEAKELCIQLTAQCLQSMARGESILILWFYSSSLETCGRWFQQLWAESLGKKMDLAGRPARPVSTPITLLGANDQHSVLQQVVEGQRDKFIWFVRDQLAEEYGAVLQQDLWGNLSDLVGQPLGALLQSEARATRDTLEKVGVHSLTLRMKPNEQDLGFFFMLSQMVVATIGSYHNINTFDQPGVEAGKVLARSYLADRD